MGRHGRADDNYIHDEESVRSLAAGFHLSYVGIFRSLGRRFAGLRRFLAPYRARLDERWIENALVLRALPDPPAKILDVGGATSPLPMILAALGHDLTVVDLRPYGLRHPRVRVLQGDVRDCAGLAPPYDAVYSVSVIEHAGLAKYGEAVEASRPRELLARMVDLARSGGSVVVTVPFGAAHVPKIGDRSAQTGKPTGFRVFDRAMLRDLTEGWDIEDQRTFGLREGSWAPMAPEEVERIPLRRYATGVAFVRIRPSTRPPGE